MRRGERFGLDPDYILRVRAERADPGTVLRQQVLTRRFGSGLSLGLVHGNIAIASKLACTLGMRAPMLDAAHSAWADAEATLGSGADHTAIIRWLERLPPIAAEAGESAEPVP